MKECKIIELYKNGNAKNEPKIDYTTDTGVTVGEYIYYDKILNQYLSDGCKIAGIARDRGALVVALER